MFYTDLDPKTPLRLADGRTPTEGRVEVRLNGVWHSVCDNMFDTTDAAVVCYTLGYALSTSER